MLTVIIPAAGNGQRFVDAGYPQKPLVDVLGKPMISRVIENLRPAVSNRVVVISRLDDKDIDPLLKDNDVHIQLSEPTEGAVDTILKAKDYFTTEPVLIGNADQLVGFNVNDFIECAKVLDGSIVTFVSNLPHHSYVTTDMWGVIDSIKEKEVISNRAVTGVYYFRSGQDFLQYANQVINADDRVNGEHYVSSVISRMIAEGLSIATYDAPSAMLGTPMELQLFETVHAVQKMLAL